MSSGCWAELLIVSVSSAGSVGACVPLLWLTRLRSTYLRTEYHVLGRTAAAGGMAAWSYGYTIRVGLLWPVAHAAVHRFPTIPHADAANDDADISNPAVSISCAVVWLVARTRLSSEFPHWQELPHHLWWRSLTCSIQHPCQTLSRAISPSLPLWFPPPRDAEICTETSRASIPLSLAYVIVSPGRGQMATGGCVSENSATGLGTDEHLLLYCVYPTTHTHTATTATPCVAPLKRWNTVGQKPSSRARPALLLSAGSDD